MIEVRLTMHQMATTAYVGMRRQLAALMRKRENYGNHAHEKPFDDHILGAMAEYAVAQKFNLFWDGHVDVIDGHDVGGLIEVRCRRPWNGHDLAIRPKDIEEKPDKPFLLVHGEPPHFLLVGWMMARDAKDHGEWNERSQLYYVQATFPPLLPIEDLFDLVELRRPVSPAAQAAINGGPDEVASFVMGER